MPESLERWIATARAYLEQFSTQKKIIAAVVTGVIVVAMIAGGAATQRSSYKVLYSDLEARDSREVVKKLGELTIPYVTSEDGAVISIPDDKVELARMELAKDGLPGQDVVGFEKFDSSTIGMSSYVQRIQYVRAVQGELIRSIERLKSVRNARVHISIPPKKTFLEDQNPPKASVVLELASRGGPSKAEIAGIAHLVASGVEGLKVDQISIVDTRGNFLHRPGTNEEGEAPRRLLEMQRNIEQEYQQRVEDILTPVVGIGNVRAKVTVEIDPSRVNSTEETFDSANSTVKSSIKNEEISGGSRPNPIGIPGSRSNLPGAEVENPAVPMASTNTEKIQQNQNFAIPRKITVTDRPSGTIERLTVAVVVDGVTKDGKFEPRSEEELQRLRNLVADSIGYDEGRRDSITINSMPFAITDLSPPGSVPTTGPWWSKEELTRHLVRNGLIALVIIVFFFLVLRPFLKWSSAADLAGELESLPRTVAEIEGNSPADLLSLSEASPVLEESEPLDKREEKELKEKILARLQDSPKKGYRIVQDWIDEGTSYTPVKS